MKQLSKPWSAKAVTYINLAIKLSGYSAVSRDLKFILIGMTINCIRILL